MSALPMISIADLRSANTATRLDTARALGQACREVGFFYVVDHGLDPQAREAVFAASRQLFDLPQLQKDALSIKRSPHNRGYVAMADEKLNPEAGSDMKEAFNVGVDLSPNHPEVLAGKPFRGVNFWPPITGWREQVLDYFEQCLNLGRTLHEGFSLDLGLPADFFAPHLANPIATLRMLRYPASSGYIDREDGGAGAHTDYGNITLLATDAVPGLEVADRKGNWVEPPHVPDAFICNIGDCLMRWSNDAYISTPHRVRPPEQERYAIAFFLEPAPDSIVDPRDISREPPRYEPITCAEYLSSRLNATYDHRAVADE